MVKLSGYGGADAPQWNMALATLIRMDSLLQESNFYSRDGNFLSWRKTLIVLYRELHPFLKKEEIKDIEKQLGESDKIERVYSKVMTGEIRFSEAPIYKYKSEFFISLNGIEICLRDLMQKHNLIMPEPDDPRFAIR